MDNEKTLTSQQRIAIIEEMIQTAQGRITDNSFHFLLWGWVIVLANIAQYVLINHTIYEYPYAVWLITLPTALVSYLYGYKMEQKSTTKTYTDRLSMWIWTGLFFCIIIVILVGSKINYMINPMISLLVGYATFISGIMIKFRPLVVGGVLFWIASIVAFYMPYHLHNLVGAISIITGYLIPGYMLKSKLRNG